MDWLHDAHARWLLLQWLDNIALWSFVIVVLLALVFIALSSDSPLDEIGRTFFRWVIVGAFAVEVLYWICRWQFSWVGIL